MSELFHLSLVIEEHNRDDPLKDHTRIRFPARLELALFVSVSALPLDQTCLLTGNAGRIFPQRQSGRGVNFGTRFHLVPVSRMAEAQGLSYFSSCRLFYFILVHIFMSFA